MADQLEYSKSYSTFITHKLLVYTLKHIFSLESIEANLSISLFMDSYVYLPLRLILNLSEILEFYTTEEDFSLACTEAEVMISDNYLVKRMHIENKGLYVHTQFLKYCVVQQIPNNAGKNEREFNFIGFNKEENAIDAYEKLVKSGFQCGFEGGMGKDCLKSFLDKPGDRGCGVDKRLGNSVPDFGVRRRQLVTQVENESDLVLHVFLVPLMLERGGVVRVI